MKYLGVLLLLALVGCESFQKTGQTYEFHDIEPGIHSARGS